MEITYKREMRHNYLIVEPDAMENSTYEIGMMGNNCIEGLLKFHMKFLDCRRLFYYEITSKQPLARLLEQHNAHAWEICRLICGIGNTLARMESFLLEEEQILLQPEYIYVEPETFGIWLCLIPGKEGDFPKEMTKLLQYILGKVDHQDKESVVLAYGLYQESLKENYGIEDLMKLVGAAAGEKASYFAKDMSSPEDKKEPETVLTEPEVASEGREKVAFATNVKAETSDSQGIKWFLMVFALAGLPALVWLFMGANGLAQYWWYLAGIDAVSGVSIFLSWIRERKGDEARKKKVGAVYEKKRWIEEKRQNTDWQMIFEEDEPETSGKLKETEPMAGTCRTAADRLVPKTEPGEQDTVLLADLSETRGARRLTSLDKSVEDIEISYYPFIIGKQPGLSDYVLNKETVSRLHVRVDREGDEYQVTDLNSTNGTMVRGRMLETNETVTISLGDEVYIANIGFIFT